MSRLIYAPLRGTLGRLRARRRPVSRRSLGADMRREIQPLPQLTTGLEENL